jgi:exonuclease SbcC
MNISSISGLNFKGRSFHNPLTPITVFVGNNFTGKSSRVEAMYLALAGFLPRIERKANSIFERLSSGSPMTVKVEFDDGKFVGREYQKRPKGGVGCTVSVRGLSPDWAIDPALIDANEFLGLSGKERVKYLFQRLTVEGSVITPTALIERLNQQFTAANEPVTQPMGEYITQLETEVCEDHERAMEGGIPPQVWLEALMVNMNERRKQAAQAVEMLMKSQVGMAGSAVEGKADRKQLAENLKQARQLFVDAVDAKAKAKAAVETVTASLNDIVEQRKLADALQAQEAAAEAVSEARAMLERLDKMKCCPHCRSKDKGWRTWLRKTAWAELDEQLKLQGEADRSYRQAAMALDAKREQLKTAAPDPALAEALNRAIAVVNERTQARDAAEAEWQKVVARDAEEAQRQRVATEMRARGTEVTVLKELCKTLQLTLDKLVEDSIQPFLADVNALCGDILTAPISYRDGEFGMQREGFATWRSFSGSEEALFLCAVSLALAKGAKIKMAVLDEIGRLDDGTKGKVFARVMELIEAGVIGRAILIDAGSSAWWLKQEQKINGDLSVIAVK